MQHLPGYLHSLLIGMRMLHLPSLPYSFFSIFIYLRHIYKKQICANPFKSVQSKIRVPDR